MRNLTFCAALGAMAAALIVPSRDASGALEIRQIAVFVDGRILAIAGASTVEGGKVRLELSGGGSLDIPATRLDRVIEDAVEVPDAPLPRPPACAAAFADLPLPEGTAFGAEIERASREANLHPRLVAAVVEAESRWNPYAISRVGASGLMQLMPAVWTAERLSNPFEPRGNLRAGCRHLRRLIERYGDVTLALAAYNAGAAAVDRYGGVPPYRETRGYVRRILARFCPEGVVAADASAR